MKTLVISAFPGCGKSFLFNSETPWTTTLDSDSSTFDKSDFPRNYIEHIKENIGKVNIILVSSHKVVRDALIENNIDFILFYPEKFLKNEYLQRYKKRGSNEKFIELLSNNWNAWIEEIENDNKIKKKISLKTNEFLSDVLPSHNRGLIINEFLDHKGEFVITSFWGVKRFIGIVQDDFDYYYCLFDGRHITLETFVGSLVWLKDKIDEKDYKEFQRLAKLNHEDYIVKEVSKTNSDCPTQSVYREQKEKSLLEIRKNSEFGNNQLILPLYWDFE